MDRYLDSVVEFVNEMAPLEAMNKNQKKDKARKKEAVQMALAKRAPKRIKRCVGSIVI